MKWAKRKKMVGFVWLVFPNEFCKHISTFSWKWNLDWCHLEALLYYYHPKFVISRETAFFKKKILFFFFSPNNHLEMGN